jgi:hypothetical protein
MVLQDFGGMIYDCLCESESKRGVKGNAFYGV